MQTAQAPLPFARSTVRNYQQLPDQPITDQLQLATVDCQRVGFLADVDLYVFGTITPDSDASGNWGTNYFPWNILQNVTLSLNTGIDVVNVSGYSLFLINSLMHRVTQPGLPVPADGGFNNSGAKGPITGRVVFPTGAISAGTTVPFGFHLKIPVAADDGLSVGLIQLQNQAYVATVKAQIGRFSDWGNLGTSPTISATVRCTQRHFSVPKDPQSFPDLRFIHQWLEQQTAWSASGQQQYQPPLGGIIARMIMDFQNDGAPQPFFSTNNDPNTPNFGQLIVQFAGSQRPEVLDYRVRLQQMYEQYGFDLPIGCLVHDFSLGGGSEEAGLNPRDMYDTGTLTDFEFLTDVSVTPTAGKIRYIREQLLRRSA